MNKSLENIIKENRSEFDDLEPSDRLWNKINQDIQPESPKSQNSLNVWWKVAAVFLLFSTSVLLYDKYSPASDEVAVEMPNEFMEAESYYSDLIVQKRNQLVNYKISDQELSADFLIEIDRLDSMYSMLKTEFSNNQSNEQIQDAMIVNLQLRLNILNQQLEILERLENLENDENIST